MLLWHLYDTLMHDAESAQINNPATYIGSIQDELIQSFSGSFLSLLMPDQKVNWLPIWNGTVPTAQ